MELRWQTEVNSSIYASPPIVDINSTVSSSLFLKLVVEATISFKVAEGSWPENHRGIVIALTSGIDEKIQVAVAWSLFVIVM